MPRAAKIVSAMIASPGDTGGERQAIKDALIRWNAAHGEDFGVQLNPVMWETHATPGLEGRPQGMINDQLIPISDFLIAVFHARIGSPTGIEISGTVEEIKEFRLAGKYVLLYFFQGDVSLRELDAAQLVLLNKFKDEMYHEGLVGEYSHISELREHLAYHLTSVVRKLVGCKSLGEASRLEESATANRDEWFKRLESEFATRVREGNFHGFDTLPATLLTVQTSLANPLEYDDLYGCVLATGRQLRPGADAVNWTDGFQTVELATSGALLHAYGGDYEAFKASYPNTLSGREKARRRAEAERESEPELWSATYRNSHPRYHSNAGPAPQLLNATDLQMNLVSHAFDQCRLLAELKLPFPWLIGASLVGANGFCLLLGSNESPRTIETDELDLGHCTIQSFEQATDRIALAGLLRSLLNRLCRTVGWERSDCFTSQGILNQRFLD
jgi:hypothetical protein